MRVIRFATGDDIPRPGILEPDGTVRSVDGDVYHYPTKGQPVASLEDVRLLAPCEPSKILCVGRNYKSNLRSKNLEFPTEPVVFLKTPNTIVGTGDDIIRPSGIEQFIFEGELAAVIGRTARRVSVDDATGYVAGYTCANDMTAHDWRLVDDHWTRAKASDTLCPIGPWIETEISADDLALTTHVNGEQRQSGRTSDMVFNVADIIAYLSRSITLWPGDVVITGSPPGAGPVNDGDVIEIELEGVGKLRNTVRPESA